MTVEAFLSLGSNLGDRQEYLKKAVAALKNTEGITVVAISSLYETDPFGDVEQDCFLNMVLKIETSLRPQELLNIAMAIEKDLERVRSIRWGPRTVDIDILLYGEQVIDTANLVIPHMGIRERAFVLIPLLEIAPRVKLPNGEQLSEYLEKIKKDIESVRLYV